MNFVKIITIIGFIASLMVMYMTDHGIPGIRKHDPSFQLLDMRFRYSAEEVKETFDKIGSEGRVAYRNYIILDFIFVVFFLGVMFIVTNKAVDWMFMRNIIFIVCILRALFDVLENILFLVMLSSYPVFNYTLATICSWFTTLKFIMLYFWILVLVIRFGRFIIK